MGPQWFGTIFTERQWAGNGRSGGEVLSLHASHYRPTEQTCKSDISERLLKEFFTLTVLLAKVKTYNSIVCSHTALSPSSSLRSPAHSTDSEREASEVRREEPDEAWLGGRLPIRRLIQCSHKEELVDPKLPDSRWTLGVQHRMIHGGCDCETEDTDQRVGSIIIQ